MKKKLAKDIEVLGQHTKKKLVKEEKEFSQQIKKEIRQAEAAKDKDKEENNKDLVETKEICPCRTDEEENNMEAQTR